MSKRLRCAIGMLLTVAMTLVNFTAFATSPTVSSDIPVNVYPNAPRTIFNIQHNGTNFNWSLTRNDNGVISPVVDRTGSIPAQTFQGNNVSSSVTVPWNYLYDGDFVDDSVGYPHQLVVQSGGNTTTTVDFYVNWMADEGFDQVSLTSVYDPSIENEDPPKSHRYYHNTVCAFGPHFRDESPELTDKWYMFTPIDLSHDGTQTYELVAGNVFVIGKLKVIVAGDEVMLKYRYFNSKIQSNDEFFTFLPDYSSITTVTPEEIKDQYRYNEVLSIAEDLNGDKNVILFVRNIATFRDNNPDIVRFFDSRKWRRELKASMLAMMD